jgi:NADH-quinone oxidoreductase subunit N
MTHRWSIMLWIIAALSMTVGNLGALTQRDVKRMLAYSSIAHAGYLLAAFTAFPHQGIAAACFYTAAYAAMNVGAFIVVTEAAGYEETLRTVEDYQGLALRRPVLAGLLAFFLLSLIGIPFTGGFFGKFYVFASALQAGHVWLAVVGLINSGVACYYYLRLLASVYTRREEQIAEISRSSTSVPAGLALALTAAATLMLGVMPGRVLHLADYASWMLQPSQSAASGANGNVSAAEAGTPAVQR